MRSPTATVTTVLILTPAAANAFAFASGVLYQQHSVGFVSQNVRRDVHFQPCNPEHDAISSRSRAPGSTAPSVIRGCRRLDMAVGAAAATFGTVASAGRAAAAIGAAKTAALVLRGGAVETNVLGGVLAELANIRTPAALLGGAALGTMYVGPKPGGNWRLHLLYTALATWAFSLQLVCVLCSTLTYTAVASRGEAIATSAIGYLSEHMQFEFFVIRASFIYGLFSFLGALMVRGWMTYPTKSEQGSARVMSAILAASALFLLNFLHYTHNALTLCLGGMTQRLIWMTVRNMYGTKKRLLRHCAWIGAIWFFVTVFKLGPNQGHERLRAPGNKTEK